MKKVCLIFVCLFCCNVFAIPEMSTSQAMIIVTTDINYDRFPPWKHQLAWKVLIGNTKAYKYALSRGAGKTPAWFYKLADEAVYGNPRNGKRHK